METSGASPSKTPATPTLHLANPPSRAIAAGGLALMVLPTSIVGNDFLILGGVSLEVGGWFLAHRHGRLQGLVDANQNGIDDRLENRGKAGGA